MKRKLIDFQVVDRDVERYPDGYVTERAKGLSLYDSAFRDLILKFTDHPEECHDKWPPGHEAAGLPKDGFTLLNISGGCRSGATKIVGVRTPPYTWDGVGTRHQ